MQIDWITVSAQIINFLILVWLLKHFLYQPVVRAMEQREQKISNRLHDAEERERQANEKMLHYLNKTDELEHKQNEILSKAKENAQQQKKQLLEEAREEVAKTRAKWQQQVNEEKEEFLSNLRRRMIEVIETLARKTLSDLADTGLEERIIQAFISKLKSLDNETRNALADISEPFQVTSAFELDSPVRSQITRVIHEQFADGVKVEYTQSPELICGIALSSGGRQLSWNLASYLDELTAQIETTFAPTEATKEEA